MFNFLFGKNKNILIESTNNGSHGDHWAAIYGFEFLSKNEDILQTKIVNILESSIPKTINKHSQLFNQQEGQLNTYVIYNSKIENVNTAYPVLDSNIEIPFLTKKIIEWNHSNNSEAIICGGGRNTFGINFFAVDYEKNKDVYKSKETLNIKLSAISYVIKEAPESNQQMSDDFIGYMPSSQANETAGYDFVGKIIDITELNENKINGYILKVKLIEHHEQEDFFYIDMFVNKENMRIKEINKGMRISGCFWAQGRIVE